jgi:hypothetical protein
MLFVNLSAGSPPYPVQAVGDTAATRIHSAAYSAAEALFKLPWRIHYDHELYPRGTTLDIPALGLVLPWPEGTLPWWIWLQVPCFALSLLLPLAVLAPGPAPPTETRQPAQQ